MSLPPNLPSLLLPSAVAHPAAIYTARYCSQVIALTSSLLINNTLNSPSSKLTSLLPLYAASDMASTRCLMVMLVVMCGLLSMTLAMPSPTPDAEAEASRYHSIDRYGYQQQDNHHHHHHDDDHDDDGHYHLTINKHGGVSGYYHEHDPRLHTATGHHYQPSSSQYQPYRRNQGHRHFG
ncbi:hypothetical protein Pmani_026067 [Petrolisthes manimaculis]|uniref:Uncharacterized protein n=1 Tax=Petrolisthes manimaculis TaxID=1843537 RepID=A0AAE1P4T9_9EUCA|nr:hypothetical protein Pmani_026067 [Petrolisthes manimaculis]